jgi:hypothetical protein
MGANGYGESHSCSIIVRPQQEWQAVPATRKWLEKPAKRGTDQVGGIGGSAALERLR